MKPPDPLWLFQAARQSGKTETLRCLVESAVKNNLYFLALRNEIQRAGWPKNKTKQKRVNKLFRYIARVKPRKEHCAILNPF